MVCLKKQTVDVFCSWGCAADVAINCMEDGKVAYCLDTSSEEAKQIAHQLINAAHRADELERIAQLRDNEKRCDICNRQTDMVVVGAIEQHDTRICTICSIDIAKQVKERLDLIPF